MYKCLDLQIKIIYVTLEIESIILYHLQIIINYSHYLLQKKLQAILTFNTNRRRQKKVQIRVPLRRIRRASPFALRFHSEEVHSRMGGIPGVIWNRSRREKEDGDEECYCYRTRMVAFISASIV